MYIICANVTTNDKCICQSFRPFNYFQIFLLLFTLLSIVLSSSNASFHAPLSRLLLFVPLSVQSAAFQMESSCIFFLRQVLRSSSCVEVATISLHRIEGLVDFVAEGAADCTVLLLSWGFTIRDLWSTCWWKQTPPLVDSLKLRSKTFIPWIPT